MGIVICVKDGRLTLCIVCRMAEVALDIAVAAEHAPTTASFVTIQLLGGAGATPHANATAVCPPLVKFIHIDVYIYVYIYIYIYICICLYIYIHIYIYTSVNNKTG